MRQYPKRRSWRGHVDSNEHFAKLMLHLVSWNRVALTRRLRDTLIYAKEAKSADERERERQSTPAPGSIAVGPSKEEPAMLDNSTTTSFVKPYNSTL